MQKTTIAAVIAAVFTASVPLAYADDAPVGSERGVKETLSDAAITTSVKTKLLANSQTDGLDINVTTQNGVVILSGEVSSEAEKSLAFQIASGTNGVLSVQDQLSIGGDS